MSDLFDFDLDMEDLAGIDIQEESEASFEVIPAIFESRDGQIKEVIYLTQEVDTAVLFNTDLDTFSSYEFFTLPDGKEVKNLEALSRFKLEEPVQLTETAIKKSKLDTFNNQYLRAMIEN